MLAHTGLNIYKYECHILLLKCIQILNVTNFLAIFVLDQNCFIIADLFVVAHSAQKESTLIVERVY